MRVSTFRGLGLSLGSGLGRAAWLGFLLLLTTRLSWAQPASLVSYVGGPGADKLLDVVRLSDGTCLVAGAAPNLDWLPATVPRTELSGAGGIRNGSSPARQVSFILHLSADLSRVLRVVSLPLGAAESIARLKSTEVPGQPTGTLFISGTTADTRANAGGYFLARLNNNFVSGTPTALVWTYNVWAEGYVYKFQPWDVGSDGRVVFVTGQSIAADWCAAQALDGATGALAVVPNWRTHWLKTGGEYKGLAANAPGGEVAVSYSGIVFKKTGRCDLRSWTAADYDVRLPDGNGRQRQGRWPVDAFFGGPCDPAAPTASGRGYTGYRTGPGQTYGVGALVVDRRSNDVYVGFNVQTVLPTGEPDFEPAVLALAASGELRWWSRLYHELTTDNKPLNSSPDQYVDGLALDYSAAAAPGGTLVVLARCHGNNVSNFWSGNAVAAVPGAQGYQNRFTGTSGNIHISWLGKLALADGTLRGSSYLAEYANAASGTGPAAADPNLDGWPNPNAGWLNLNTTREGTLRVGADGAVAVTIKGCRVMTTRGAYQRMLRLSMATPPSPPNPPNAIQTNNWAGVWASFVRVYAPDLGSVRYSSALAGAWNPTTGSSGTNTELAAALPETDRVLAVGWQSADASGAASGQPVPTVAVPAWGRAAPAGQSGLLASLRLTAAASPAPLPVRLVGFEARRTGPTAARLSWATASEQDNAGFDIEKSPDGQQFTALGFVPGQGATLQPQAYAYVDGRAIAAAYYRLAQRDFGGQLTYSATAFVAAPAERPGAPAQLSCWPNPTHDLVQVQLSGGPGALPAGTEAQVLDLLGRVLLRQPLNPGGAPTPLSISVLAPGCYLVQVRTAEGRLTQPLLVR